MSRLVSVLAVFIAAFACDAAIAAAASPPAVRTGGATLVTPQSATVRGAIDPHGVPTAFYFQFGTSTSYRFRTSTGDAGAGARSTAVAAALTALRPNTTYHYRLVAFSSGGTRHGADRKFKTLQIPTTSSLSVSPNPVAYGGVVSIVGSLSGPNVGGQKVALQANPFPFPGPFQQVGNTVLATPTGAYTFLTPMLSTTMVRALDLSKPLVTSPTVLVYVALRTTVRVRRSRTGRDVVRFSGRVKPARAGNRVLIQRKKRRGWATVAITKTHPKKPAFSVFSRRVRLHRSGRYRVLVKPIAGDYVDGASRSVRVRR